MSGGIEPLVIHNGNEFAAWLADKPKAGTRCQYYRGFLAKDRGQQDRYELDLLADLVWVQYTHGRVTLVQRRLGDNDYLYFAETILPRKIVQPTARKSLARARQALGIEG